MSYDETLELSSLTAKLPENVAISRALDSMHIFAGTDFKFASHLESNGKRSIERKDAIYLHMMMFLRFFFLQLVSLFSRHPVPFPARVVTAELRAKLIYTPRLPLFPFAYRL